MTKLYRVTIDEYDGEAGVRYVWLTADEARAVADLLTDWRMPVTDYLELVEPSDPAAVITELRELRDSAEERDWTSRHSQY